MGLKASKPSTRFDFILQDRYMNGMSSILINYKEVCQNVAKAVQKSGRQLDSAKILVISKGQSVKNIQTLLDLGQTRFGENYAQEWRSKQLELEKTPIEWHFVGRLQSNKLKYLIDHIKLFHSLDRWELAVKMDEMSEKKNIKTSVLIEVDLANQSSKTGIHEAELSSFVEKLNGLQHLDLQGFMTFPPPNENPEDSRPYYKGLREILFEFNQKNVYKTPLTELSMGMSNDYEVATEEGATYLRIGRTFFKDL